MGNITIMLIALLIIQSVVMALVLFCGRKDRMKLVEMLAARSYGEYVSLSGGSGKDAGSDKQLGKHKNMVIAQQDKMRPKRE